MAEESVIVLQNDSLLPVESSLQEEYITSFLPENQDTFRQEEQQIIVPTAEVVHSKRVPAKVFLPSGKTLRLLAEDLFGSRDFWVYLYLENKGIISNPNRVPSGIELRIPDKTTYAIDVSDPNSIAKAKKLGRKVLEGMND